MYVVVSVGRWKHSWEIITTSIIIIIIIVIIIAITIITIAIITITVTIIITIIINIIIITERCWTPPLPTYRHPAAKALWMVVYVCCGGALPP